MGKEIKVVCGLIYDDEFHARTGGTRFYHLNGDIETNADGGAGVCLHKAKSAR